MKRPCLFPACRSLLDQGGYCIAHAHHANRSQRDADIRRMADPVTAMTAKFRWTKQWQRTRHQKLIDNPLCEDPHGFHGVNTTSASQVHHIQPIATHYHLRLHSANLMSLCTRCHEIFSRRERNPEP